MKPEKRRHRAKRLFPRDQHPWPNIKQDGGLEKKTWSIQAPATATKAGAMSKRILYLCCHLGNRHGINQWPLMHVRAKSATDPKPADRLDQLVGKLFIDTFVDNEVKLRKGTIYQCAEYGGFGILDEINMAKNDAVSVLHATLDYRRSIDVPGYDKIDLHPAARFIGTMNYGYAGTKELNEALVSRFLVIDMPAQTEESLEFIFQRMFPNIKENARTQFIGVFLDLQLKATNSEISTKPLDLRGLLAAMKIVETGLSPRKAVTMGVVNKTFDIFEKEIVEDIVKTRIPADWTRDDVYER